MQASIMLQFGLCSFSFLKKQMHVACSVCAVGKEIIGNREEEKLKLSNPELGSVRIIFVHVM